MKKRIVILICLLCVFLNGCGETEDEIVLRYETESDNRYSDSSSRLNAADYSGFVVDNESENNEKVAEDPEDSQLLLVVYVCGEVNNPGIYELASGSRMFDAVDAAGGYSVNAAETYLNLAECIQDGQKIYVPSVEELEENSPTVNINNSGAVGNISESSGESNKTKVNINTATESELMTVPGIGQSKAKAIIAYRSEKGNFNSTEDIMQITGIKEGLYSKVKDYICVK